jgi:hypothetical protein
MFRQLLPIGALLLGAACIANIAISKRANRKKPVAFIYNGLVLQQ